MATTATTTTQPTVEPVAPWDAQEGTVMTVDGRELTVEAAAARADEELVRRAGWGDLADRLRLKDLVGTAGLF
ncbi:hypothetical protein J7F01_08920 [Streptomyces sp. ISL-22]|uniref:hypothetical protein n=1 Tax=unclassified Streptomyces TaxID=2593676 RepID=UPI001BE7505D|nr:MULTISPECIES: hypothetical protein [unclassified Streptomyces]MBT2418001.1 hypothetical protein [Streptomyces sp. ISL-24]MBT2432324.1 hypothetical protein [Streptomyces sp. ISL-22]